MARFINAVSILILIVVACYFYHFVFQNAVNVPYFDDFAYLGYIQELLDAPNAVEFLGKFLDKHNGHGILTAKLAFWLDYCLEGQINYRTLIIAGSGLVILIFGYFALILRRNRFSWAYSMPIGLLLFSPAYHENIFWAAASWQYTASFVAGAAMFYMMVRKEKWVFALAMLVGFITTYTNGNGLVGFFAGTILLLLQGRHLRAALWFASAVCTSVVFYWYYPYGMGTSDGHHLKPFVTTLISFCGALGIYLRANRFEIILAGIPFALGLIFLLVWIATEYFDRFFHYYRRLSIMPIFLKSAENLSLVGMVLWLLSTGLGTALTRASVHFDAPLRYMIYSIMIAVTLYTVILLVGRASVRRVSFVVAGLGGMIFQFGSYLYAAPDVINFRNTLWADVYNLQEHMHVSSKVETMNPLVTQVFKQSLSRGIYSFPVTPLVPDVAVLDVVDEDRDESNALSFSITRDTLKVYGGILITRIGSASIALDQSDPENGVYIALKSATNGSVHLFAVAQTRNLNRRKFLKTFEHFDPGFVASVFAGNVPVGRYRIGLLRLENGIHRLDYAKQSVDVYQLKPNDEYL